MFRQKESCHSVWNTEKQQGSEFAHLITREKYITGNVHLSNGGHQI